MLKSLRIVAVSAVCFALLFGVSTILAAPGGRPAPKPPVLCGCLCDDGSFVTTHAKNAKQCPRACEAACEAPSGEF
jgi:hypothetical protein